MLETRGIKPDPKTRGLLAKYIYLEINRYWRLEIPYMSHYMIYGVYCGPTIPSNLLGVEQLMNLIETKRA